MQKFITEEEISSLSKEEKNVLEQLIKKCPRCGQVSANKSNPAGRCRKHLNKLAKDKKTPGHWQRSQTKFDDAKRRENGKNGTASKKNKGRASSRKQFVKRFQRDEKKAGAKLSPDRIKNERGYESKNVRNIPEKLNRGRHKVDPKKLKAWRERMKKSSIDAEMMHLAMLAKANEQNNEQLLTLLRAIDHTEVEKLIDIIETISE